MITKSYIQNLSKLQRQIRELIDEYDVYSSQLLPLIEKYFKIENINFNKIKKIEVDIGEIDPSHVYVTCVIYGYYGSHDQEITHEIPISFFINEEAMKNLQLTRLMEKRIAVERARQLEIECLTEKIKNLTIQIENLTINSLEPK